MMKRWIFILTALATMATFSTASAQQALFFNEINADPAGDLTGDSNGDGIRSSSQDEFVELANMSADSLDLTGWMLGDDEAINFTFPDGYKLAPRHLLVVFGGGDVTGVDGYNADPLLTRVFSADSTVGNGLANGGEYLVLKSPDGTADSYAGYGSKVGLGAPATAATDGITFEYGTDVNAPANDNQSATRSPDGNTTDAEPWALHSTVSSALFSPGVTVSGTNVIPIPPPTLTVIINEILADPASGTAGDANGDGIRSSSQDEFVELANVSSDPVDLTGWKLGDDEAVNFTFPDGYMMAPRSFLVVFGGGDVTGVDGYDADPLVTRVFSADSTVGNGLANGGEIILLHSADGSYDTWLAYGSKAATGGPPNADNYQIQIDVGAAANADNSITRFPDGNVNILDPFVQHLTVANAAFSPNTTIDGRSAVPPPQPQVTVVINEVLADAMGAGDANGDSVINASEDQFIEIVNTSEDTAVDLGGWHVGDESGMTFTFPAGYMLAKQAMVAVFGGGDVSGAPGYSADPMLTRVFAASGALGDGLDAAGDFAVLASSDGSYDAYVAFGSKAATGDPAISTMPDAEWEFATSTSAAADQQTSITRNPDGNILAQDPFVLHSSISQVAYSPAQTTDALNSLDDFVDVEHPWGTGYAMHFNWWERDRVEIRDAASLFPLRMDQGTVEMWFRPDSVLTDDTHAPDWTYLFGKNIGGNNPGDLGLGWRRSEGRMIFFMQDGTTTTDLEQSQKVDEVFFPRWYHVAVTWNTADSMRIFLDGEQKAAIESAVPLLGGVMPMAIGNGAADLWNSRFEGFRGMIDEVRVSVVERYTENFDLPTAPYANDALTLALWHFDEGSGETTVDATGNGFVGSLGGLDVDGNPDSASLPSWVEVSTIVATETTELPLQFELSQNYPNPFNPSTAIEYLVPAVSKVDIHVYNVLGQRITTLVSGEHAAGVHQVTFDASRYASGMYFYTLRSGTTLLTQKMLLIK
ncbi:MAG: T9SS type A sorting domain-containing protein [Bacteroidetes Order II. Incertae sedis bacterium]|nr:T9SS type A sorting domain-containing protein [Bacteroidetes Order II. bacterium]